MAARRMADQERASSATEARVADLVAEGRSLYSEGRYTDAADRFEAALTLDPRSDLAQSYLELAEERQRSRPADPGSPQRAGTSPESRPAGRPAIVPSRPEPTPGTARITVFFDSPINAGSVEVSLDGRAIATIPFDFTRKAMFGIKRKGSGRVKRVVVVPAGRHTVGVRLVDTEAGPRGDATFSEALAGGSDWTLRVDLADREGTPAFALVHSAGG
jgi:hypothetical protein